MPIDLVIDERDSSKPLPELGGSTNGNDGRSNADSTSHTDGASTPDVVREQSHVLITYMDCRVDPNMFYIIIGLFQSQPMQQTFGKLIVY